jgi:hypothetical protein
LCELYLGVVAVERRWWRRRRSAKTVAVAQEVRGVDGSSGDRSEEGGIDGGGGDHGIESGGDLESFGMKNETTWVGYYL